MKNPTQRPTGPAQTQESSAPSRVVDHVLLFVYLTILALRVTYTEGPVAQTLTLPGSQFDTIYSLSVSGLLAAALSVWFLAGIWRGRVTYRLTGMEIGLILFLIGGVVSTLAAGEKRLAINTVVIQAGPLLAALLLVQLLDRACRIRTVLLVVAALGVVFAYQCIEQFFVSNQILIEKYTEAPETLLEPLGIAPGTLQHFLFEHRLYGQGVRGFFTTGNSAASFAILSLFAGLALIWPKLRTAVSGQSQPRSWWYPIVSMLLILVGLALTRSKGGILAFLFAAGLFAALHAWGKQPAKRPRLAWVVGASILVAASLAVGGAAVSYGLRYGRLPGGNSMLVRWQYWHATAQMVADHPVLGVGPGNFAQNYTRYKPASASESVSDPHNFPLSLLSQYGPLGLVSLLSIVFVPLYCGTVGKGARAEPDSSSAAGPLAGTALWVLSALLLLIRPLLIPASWGGDIELLVYEIVALYTAPVAAFLIGFFLFAAPPTHKPGVIARLAMACAVGGVLLHNLVDFAIFEPGIWMAMWTAMACFIAIGHQRRPLRPVVLRSSGRIRKMLATGAALLLAGAYVQSVWRPVYDVTTHAQRARQAATAGRFDIAHSEFDTAVTADPLSATAPSLNGRLYLQRAERDVAARSPLLEKAFENLRTAIQRDPAEYKNYERMADAAMLGGRHEEAHAWYAEAAERYPGSGRLWLQKAQAAEQIGKPNVALAAYSRVVQIEDAYRRQFRRMYPEREEVVSRIGEDNYELAKKRIAELSV